MQAECEECGARLEGGQAFCRRCGRPAPHPQPAGSPGGGPKKDGVSNRTLLGLGALVVVVLAGAGFAIASLNDGEEPQKNKASLAEKRAQRNEQRLEREVSDLKEEVSQLKENQEAEPPVAQAPDPQPPTSSGGGSSGVGDFAGYIAQLGSHRGLGSAKRQLEAILSEGGGGGIIWSSDFVQMVPGYWVVYSGPYDTQSEADQVAASSGISDAFGRYISVR